MLVETDWAETLLDWEVVHPVRNGQVKSKIRRRLCRMMVDYNISIN